MLVGGQLRSLTTLGDLLSYERAAENERLVIFLNLGHGPVQVATKQGSFSQVPILVVTQSGSTTLSSCKVQKGWSLKSFLRARE